MKNLARFHRIFFLLALSLAACANAVAPAPEPTATRAAAAPTLRTLTDYAGFLSAVQGGDLEAVRTYVDQGYDVNWTDAGGLSLLNYAANQGSCEVVSLLLEHGAAVNYQDPWGMTSLHAALKEGHDQAAVLLIDSGADVNLSTTAGYYPGFAALHVAVRFMRVSIETVRYLLEHGADVSMRTDAGQTALMLATEAGWPQAAELLIAYGASQ